MEQINNGQIKNVKNNRSKLKKRKKKPMKHRFLFRSVSIAMVIASIMLIFNLIKVDILGVKYMTIFIMIMFLLEALLLFVMNKRFKVVVKIPFLIISLFLIGGSIFGVYNLNLAADFVEKIVATTTQEEIYKVYVLNKSEYQDVKELNGTKLGYFNNGSESLEGAIKTLNSKVTFNDEESFDDLEKILDSLLDEKIDCIFISSSLTELLGEEYKSKFLELREIGSISVSIKETTKAKDKDVTKEPFLVYVSGIDTYGSIGTVSRSDVNILVAVNPKTGKILLVNTPRDYYVKLHSKKAMDKLTHAGIYGVEESMNTLGDLYARDVDYYLKINFSSLIKIVDALGGITVNSKYNFSYDGYSFKKGTNKLDGKAALAFSRCRKELPMGDVSRGENQEAVITGMISKVMNSGVITKYATILKTMEKSFVTNMSEDDIYSLAKFQLNKGPHWTVESANARGEDSYQTTYSAGRTKLYVMLPKEESVSEVKERLAGILEA